MEVTKEWLEAILMKQSRDRGISKVLKVEPVAAVAKGDNYCSDLTRVKIDVVLGSGRKTRKSIVIKEMPKTEQRRAQLGQMGFYLREIMVYRDIIPSMEKIAEEVGDTTEPLWGQCLEIEPYEKLVLEDLSEKGYKMANRLKGLDLEHAKLAVKGLAKFHALSVALQERQLIAMEIFGTGLFERNYEMMKEFQDKAFENFVNFSEKTWGDEWKPTFAKLREKVVGRVGQLLKEKVKREEGRFAVLNHGDCWLNNMLFKYADESDKPVSLRFIDFQLSFYNSPAMDLHYFFSTTPSFEVRQNNREELLEVYHKTLLNYMDKYKCKTTPITFDQLQEEMERLEIFGLITAVCLLPLLLIEAPEDVPDIEQLLKDKEAGKDVMKEMPLSMSGKTFTKIIQFSLKRCESKGVF